MENLGKLSGAKHPSITNRIQKMEDKISGVEDTIEEIDSLVKKKKKTKFLTLNG